MGPFAPSNVERQSLAESKEATKLAFFTAQSLDQSLSELSLPPAPELFRALDQAYGARDRHYHNRSHVAQCLAALHMHRALAHNAAQIALALWFHDAVYDSHKNDNEALSAAWAREFLTGVGAPTSLVEAIGTLIMATQHNSACTSADTQLLVDIDLGILGQDAEQFAAYDQAIRREYHWVPEPQYRSGRAAVLKAFLARPNIYHTPTFRQRYEQQARRNLSAALRQLESC